MNLDNLSYVSTFVYYYNLYKNINYNNEIYMKVYNLRTIKNFYNYLHIQN